jgi:hypothetical protein
MRSSHEARLAELRPTLKEAGWIRLNGWLSYGNDEQKRNAQREVDALSETTNATRAMPNLWQWQFTKLTALRAEAQRSVFFSWLATRDQDLLDGGINLDNASQVRAALERLGEIIKNNQEEFAWEE